jgi:general secretion pathway protein G
MLSYLQTQLSNKPMRGDHVKAVELSGRRVTLSRSFSRPGNPSGLQGRSRRTFGFGQDRGFTLIELVITVTVLSIMTLGVVPLLKVSAKRQKEEQLRAALRQMRTAIDEFRRDTVGMPRASLGGQQQQQQTGQQQQVLDPRSKVVISDPTIFGVDNPDMFPPDLETLVNGVNVVPRAGQGTGGQGLRSTGTEIGDTTSVLGNQLSTKKKVYLRAIPINPFTGGNEIGKDWELRSCYDEPGSDSWGGENVFDVIFPPDLDDQYKPLREDEKYSDW